MNWPYWAGIAVVGSVITFNVALGGMKGITFVQAFQYWAKVFAISLPVFVLMSVYGGYSSGLARNAGNPSGIPVFDSTRTIRFKGAKDYPANVLVCPTTGGISLRFPEGASLGKISLSRPSAPGEMAIRPRLTVVDAAGKRSEIEGQTAEIPAGGVLITEPIAVSTGPKKLVLGPDGKPLIVSTRIEFAEPTQAVIEQGTPAPNAPANKKWLEPFGPLTSKYGHPLLYTYSLIIALICGTAGLPHILVRFYTNPDGRAAKRTTLWVMVMLGAFYVFPPVWGTLGRNEMPWLYANNLTDRVVISLPTILSSKLLGDILSGVTSAGAFAAFMSTFSGLLVSMSGALAHDIYGKILRPGASPESRMFAFKIAAVLIGAASMGLGLLVETFDIAMMVGWAFAIAAASYFPLLLLGAWWRGLTKYGAASGMLIGGFSSLGAIVTSMLLDKKLIAWQPSPLVRSLLEQPAVWGVPLSVSLMVLISLATAKAVPGDVHLKMLRLHAPEEMGLSKNYIEH